MAKLRPSVLRFSGAAVAAVFIIEWSYAQPAQDPQPCVDNCLVEALAPVPVKGCPEGTVWEPWPLTSPQESCRPCPKGFYCTGTAYGECNYAGCNFPTTRVNLNRKSACPIGTFIDYEGAKQLADCKECWHGYYQDWYGSPACIPCPAGTYIDVNRSTAVDQCIPCLAGHYCPLGSPVPIPCPAGSYTRYPRMRELANCLPCTHAHYCPLGSVDPTPCPAGKWTNKTGTNGTGQYAGTYKTPGIDTGDSCTICPRGFFCPLGSVVPTSCPAGSYSPTSTQSESDCIACPVGSQCQSPASSDYAQSLVVRDANGEQLVGSPYPVLCAVDTWNWHYSYPNLTGCVEHCPYKHTHQSYCHIAGDGRLPDRNAPERRLADWITKRARYGPAMKTERDQALLALDTELGTLTSSDKLKALTVANENARTPLILAAMLADVPGMQVLWKHGAGELHNTTAARDAGGFTALMHALQFGHASSVAWLITPKPVGPEAMLSQSDLQVLIDRGVDVTGIPTKATLNVPPAYLGRGSLTWTHPDGANYTVAPYESNTDPAYSSFYGGPKR